MSRFTFHEKNLAMFFIYIPFIVLAVVVKLIFWAQVLYRQRATLALIPGPKWAAYTRFWLARTLASGKAADIFVDINKQYGLSHQLAFLSVD